ncbi:MAG: hypothetical protein J7L89_08985 [Bacteroidales bacterium]|nr:hypothetical protein [Bacteroidales bacterium]
MGILIGIGGVSNAGKTFLARELAQRLTPGPVPVFSQDDFVWPESQIPLIRDHIDWECPESIDFHRFKNEILASLKQNPYVITEGLMLYHDRDLFRHIDIRIFIELSEKDFYARKSLDLRWGAEPDWYINYIWEAYQRYGKFPAGHHPDILLDGSRDFNLDDLGEWIMVKAKS